MELCCERVVIVKLFKKQELNENQAFVYKIIKFTITSSFLFTSLIIIILLLLNTLPKEHILRNLNIGSRNTWITYLGTIFGGSLTLFGVAYSILYNLKQREIDKIESKRIELTKNRPYIYIESFETVYCISNILVVELAIRNISNTPVREFSIDNDKSYVFIKELGYKQNGNFTLNENQLILANELAKIQLVIQIPEPHDEGEYRFETDIIFTYKDITGQYLFSHGLTTIGEVQFLIHSDESLDIRFAKHESVQNKYFWHE